MGKKWKSGKGDDILVFLICVWLGGGKVEGWIFFLFGWEEKWKDRKMTLNKFTHMPSLKNDAQLKKKNHWSLLKKKKWKIMIRKKKKVKKKNDI